LKDVPGLEGRAKITTEDDGQQQCEIRLHFVRKTLLRFTPTSPTGYFAFGQGEIQSKLAPNSPNGLFWTSFD
jgi:hypothetical protein